MAKVTAHTQLVGLMANPVKESKVPDMSNRIYDLIEEDISQMAFEVDADNLAGAVESVRSLKMLGSNIAMPNITAVIQHLDEVDEAAELCGAVNCIVNQKDVYGHLTGYLKGYNTDGLGYWNFLEKEGFDCVDKKMVLIGAGGVAGAIAVTGALQGLVKISIFNAKDDFYSRAEELVDLINEKTDCLAELINLDDISTLRSKMEDCDIFCDATSVGMKPLAHLSNVPDSSFFHEEMVVTDTVYVPEETVLLSLAKDAGVERVYNGYGMMLHQVLVSVELFTGKRVNADLLNEKLLEQ